MQYEVLCMHLKMKRGWTLGIHYVDTEHYDLVLAALLSSLLDSNHYQCVDRY